MKMKINVKRLEHQREICDAAAKSAEGTALEKEFRAIAGLLVDIRILAEMGETVHFEKDEEE